MCRCWMQGRSRGIMEGAVRVGAPAQQMAVPLRLPHALQGLLRPGRCCSCTLCVRSARCRCACQMATLYIKVWGGRCFVHMDSSVWCLTLPFADWGSAVCVVHWCVLCTLLPFLGCLHSLGIFACRSMFFAHGLTDFTWTPPPCSP